MKKNGKKILLFTGQGDGGRTSLLGGQRVSKAHHRIEVLGLMDELSAALGMARASATQDETRTILVAVQRDVYQLMAEVAVVGKTRPTGLEKFDPDRVRWLEAQIEQVTPPGDPLKGFILPGDNLAGASLDFARAVARRVERRVVRETDRGRRISETVVGYLNRLSSLLFSLELHELEAQGQQPTPARPDGHGKRK